MGVGRELHIPAFLYLPGLCVSRRRENRPGSTKHDKRGGWAVPITNLQEKFLYELADIYDAEHRFLEAQQQMLKEASGQELQGMIQTHIDQTQQQLQNLEQVYEQIGQQPERVTCEVAQGLVAEGQEGMQETQAGPFRDIMIASAQLSR